VHTEVAALAVPVRICADEDARLGLREVSYWRLELADVQAGGHTLAGRGCCLCEKGDDGGGGSGNEVHDDGRD
jgi:hypothetical protein